MTNIISTLISVYDRAAECYGPVNNVSNEGVAIRGFMDAINNPVQPTDLSNHPEDFDLYAVGEFDATTGIVTGYPLEGRKPILTGKSATLRKSNSSEA